MRQHRVRLVVAAASAGLLAIPLLGGAASAAPDPRVTIPDTSPDWAVSANAAGTPAAADTVTFRVALKLRDAAGAERFAQDVSNPASSNYGRYLSAAAFTAKYAPTAAAVAKVKAYLAGEGITVTGVAEGNKWVTATGTVAQIDHAFGTVLKTYTWQGKKLRAPSAAVSLPASVGADVSTVAGLAQSAVVRQPAAKKIPDSAPKPAVKGAATPPPASQCSDYWGQYQQTLPAVDGRTVFNTYICGYSPSQLRGAYGTAESVAQGVTCKGVTVAIIDAYASPTMLGDANKYAKAVGDKPFKPGQYTEKLFEPFNVMPDECGDPSGWWGEETLDVESVHGMAPDANVLYLGAKDCDTGIDDALNYVVEHHLASIVSNSYGWTGEDVPADEIAVEHAIFVQAAAQGIGLYFSSGDNGDNVINGMQPQPDYSASDPLVTAVGGTTLLLDKSGNRFAEVGWEDSFSDVNYDGKKAVYDQKPPGYFYFGAGGGVSTLFAQPWYQQGTVPAKLATRHGKAMRVSPDISAVGDPYTGFYYGQTVDGEFGIGTIGGTSLSCPLIAGIQALASQNRKFAIGFANPLLYSLSGSAFRDVVPHTPIHFSSVGAAYLGTFDTGTTLQTAVGYDDITGRGTPRGAVFLAAEATH